MNPSSADGELQGCTLSVKFVAIQHTSRVRVETWRISHSDTLTYEECESSFRNGCLKIV
jgi:hypothetical protein